MQAADAEIASLHELLLQKSAAERKAALAQLEAESQMKTLLDKIEILER